ncbi:MAG: ROK family protein [Clostridia bacterium]
MTDCILALDAGGTSVKFGLVFSGGGMVADTVCCETFGNGSRSALEHGFLTATQVGASMAQTHHLQITTIGVACPGPFDYFEGTSHMLHKWQGLLNVPLAPLLHQVLPGVPICFLHDSTAFMLGEGLCGAARGFSRPAGVMLGTGLGFACMEQGRVRIRADQRPAFFLWNMPFRDGTAEDYASRKAVRQCYAALSGCASPPDVHSLAELAAQGNENARTAFREMGEALGDLLGKAKDDVSLDGVVVGGQIARAYALILPFAVNKLPFPIVPAEHIADAALLGIERYCTLGRDKTTKEVV